MFGSDPFAGTITERPTGMTFAGGLPCRPTRGCSTRVNCPGGSFPMTRRTSWPSSSSAAACSSACSTTAPQNDHENGTTIPIFTRGSLTIVAAARLASDAVRRDPSRDVHHGRRPAERRLLHPRPGTPAREEDGEPGRPDRLPPLLRGRGRSAGERHHLLRVHRSPERTGRGRDGDHREV